MVVLLLWLISLGCVSVGASIFIGSSGSTEHRNAVWRLIAKLGPAFSILASFLLLVLLMRSFWLSDIVNIQHVMFTTAPTLKDPRPTDRVLDLNVGSSRGLIAIGAADLAEDVGYQSKPLRWEIESAQRMPLREPGVLSTLGLRMDASLKPRGFILIFLMLIPLTGLLAIVAWWIWQRHRKRRV